MKNNRRLFWAMNPLFNILQQGMRKLVSFREFCKNSGLLLTGIVFLGTIEISASSGICEASPTLHAASHFGNIAVSDQLISEAEEERDMETRNAEFLLAGIMHLPEAAPLRRDRLPAITFSYSSRSCFSCESRGPPSL
ncbi:MAG: hypothetical protein JNJ69_08305 [Leptospiraceae bacterium]|nr:hypothetical protein [Leptospiraceae bacterium]